MGTNGSPQGRFQGPFSGAHWPPIAPLPPGHSDSSDGARGGPSDPGPLGNRGNRAPDRPVPVTAPSNMRRSLTCPSPDGPSPPDRDRPRPSRAAGRRCRERRPDRAMAVPAQVMAARTVPTPGGPGAGEPGDPPLAADAERRRTRRQGRPAGAPAARDYPPVVPCPQRHAVGKAVFRDRARLTAFTTLEVSAFCPPAGSTYGRSCAGMDG